MLLIWRNSYEVNSNINWIFYVFSIIKIEFSELLEALKKKHVFVNNKRTVIARKFFFFYKIILIFFRMIPIRLKYLNPIVEKKQK